MNKLLTKPEMWQQYCAPIWGEDMPPVYPMTVDAVFYLLQYPSEWVRIRQMAGIESSHPCDFISVPNWIWILTTEYGIGAMLLHLDLTLEQIAAEFERGYPFSEKVIQVFDQADFPDVGQRFKRFNNSASIGHDTTIERLRANSLYFLRLCNHVPAALVALLHKPVILELCRLRVNPFGISSPIPENV